MVAPRKMRRAHYHQAADIAVCGNVAYFGETTRAQEALAFELGVTDTQ